MMKNKFCCFCALHGIICDIHRELRNEYNSLNSTYATAKPIAQHIEQLSSTFKFHEQGDPSEFLVVLLDHLISCIKTNKADVDINSSLQPIQQIFGLNIVSIIECKICFNTSIVDTWESILSLPISSCSNLTESLSAYFTIEELKNGDSYSCSNCEKMVPCSKMLKISKESPVIFIHLKRFDYDVQINSTRKINLVIAYPETIALDGYFDETSRQSNKENENHSFIYKLNSVIVHLGEYATNGHVYAYVCSPDGYWYKADDERITPVDLDLVLNQKDAYILCYVKMLKNSIYLSDNETMSSPMHPSPVKISSTPKVSFQYFDKARDTHDDEILLSEIESISSNNSMDKISIDDNSFADTFSNKYSIQHCSTQPEPMILSTSIDTSSIQLDEDVPNSQVENDFVVETPALHQFNLRSVDLAKLQVVRTEKNNRKKKRLFEKMGLIDEPSNNTTAKKIFISKQVNTFKATVDNLAYNGDSSIHIGSTAERKCHVDVTYFYILLPYIKQLNKFCGLCVRNCTFGATNHAHRLLLRCKLRCSAHPICPFTCFTIVQNNGKGNIIVTNRNVRHRKGVKICRPTRTPLRNLIKQQFAQGASTYRMYQEKLQQRTPEQRQGQNYDGVGKSRCILSKIKSERVNESLLSTDVDQGLFKLLEKFRADYNSDGKVKGSIQFISKYPCQIIVYSESSIRLFDLLMKQKNVVLSWDATGSIIKEKNTNRLLYYELSATLPGVANQDSIIPITFMISNAHALVNVIHWLELFKYSFSQVFVGKNFPRPRVVLSDRAQVFLIASLKVWNNESMNEFLNRAYRIIIGDASDSDHQKTNIHACLSHVLLDARKTINKNIPDTFRNLAMWCIALLINTSTWGEFLHNWKLICNVFIELHLGQQFINKEHQETLINKISKIKNDTNTRNIINSSDTISDNDTYNSHYSNIYDYDDSDDETDPKLISHGSKSTRKKMVIDEEQQVNAMDSPFKSTISKLFYDVLKFYDIPIKKVHDRTSRGILKWFRYLIVSFMPTTPIWSNLLLGNLSRHNRQIIYSFENITTNNEEQRTTAISERRMNIVKRNQLGGEIHIRLDVLLSILVPDMMCMIDEYWNTLLGYSITSRNKNDYTICIDEQKLKPIEERWREKVSRRGAGHYAKGPSEPIVNDLISCLLAPQVNLNENLKLPVLSPVWLDVAVGMLLSVGNNNFHRHSYISTPKNTSPLLSRILKFLEEWFSSSNKKIRSTNIDISSLNLQLNEPFEQSSFILENILTLLLPCEMIIYKIHECNRCKLTTKIRSIITSIPINNSTTGLYLEKDLFAYFAPTQSDLTCLKCNTATIRHIEVQQWPQVIILNINDSKQVTRCRKPPSMLSLEQFSSWIAIGFPSSSIYHLTSFNSIVKSGDYETIVGTTKIKKHWRTTLHRKTIGEGEQLQRLYAHSRILVFERIFGANKYNLVYAFVQCTGLKCSNLTNDVGESVSIQDALKIIQNHPALNHLNDTLMASVKTRYICDFCYKFANSLEEQSTEIFLFKSISANELVAYPALSNMNYQYVNRNYCTNCNHSIENMVMNSHQQVFLKCPYYLIKFSDKNYQLLNFFKTNVQLKDIQNIVYNYEPISMLLISRYNDRATIIKMHDTSYVHYYGDTYEESSQISSSRIVDLMDTCSSILLFYQQSCKTAVAAAATHTTAVPSTINNNTASASSQMRIVSQTNVNGVKRLVITDGNHFFSITTPTDTKPS